MIYQSVITDQAKLDIAMHKKLGTKIWLKNAVLLKEIIITPFEGSGKPEPLKFELAGKWSRRINKEQRLIYELIEPNIIVVSAFGHYN